MLSKGYFKVLLIKKEPSSGWLHFIPSGHKKTVTRGDLSNINNALMFGGGYIFMKNGKPIYVGRSSNIQRRLRAHVPNIKKWRPDHIIVYQVANLYISGLIESWLIAKTIPKYNKKIKLEDM